MITSRNLEFSVIYQVLYQDVGTLKFKVSNSYIEVDPLGQPTVMVGSDHYFYMWCLYVHPSTSNFQNLTKQNYSQVGIVIATGGAVGLDQ